MPLRLLGGLHFLVLADEASWDDPTGEHADFLREFVRTQSVQTNEVQRSWVLLPCFLRAGELLGAPELDVVELGPTKNAGVAKDDAKDEDTQRGEEAVQAELDGQADAPPAPPDYAAGPPGEEQPREAEAGAAGRAGRV